MTNVIDHKLWAEDYLPRMAKKWAHAYSIDEEEAYSELLVAYAEALESYDESRASFSAYFYFFRGRALHTLLAENNKWKEYASIEGKSLDLYLQDTDKIVHLINEMDKVALNKDSLAMLEFIFNHNFVTNKERARVGKETVYREITSTLNWTWERAKKAMAGLQEFYGERAFA